MPAAPKVFISYSHDSEAHKERVLALADRLRHAGGVEAIIDRYVEPFPREGWPVWCWSQIEIADFVVMVCTEAYHRRVTNKEEAGKGHGVCWEAPIIFQLLYDQVIFQLLYDQGSLSKRFVPVLFADGSQEHVPTPVRKFGRFYVDTPGGWEQLLRHLFDKPLTPPPPPGIPPELPPAPRPGLTGAPVAVEMPKSAEPALSQPHPRVEEVFVGREADLKKLAAFLFPEDDGRRPVVVSGMAGVGKSYLVDRFYAENKDRFPGGYIRIALDPENPAAATELLAQIADRLKLPPGDASVVAAGLREPLSLMHVENVDTGDAEAVIGELAQALAGCALIASARVTTLGTDGWWRTVSLQSFDDDTALDQLAQELEETPSPDGLGAAAPSPRPSPARGEGEQQGSAQDSLSLRGRGWRATARRVRVGNDSLDLKSLRPLVHALGGLPLALHLAAGHLRFGETPESFLALLRGKGLALGPVSRADPTFRERSRQLLSGTFDLSLEALARAGGEAGAGWRAALNALGFAPAAGFGESLGAAIAGLSAAEFGDLRRAAGALSLFERVPRGKAGAAFRLHPLLAELGRARAKKDAAIARMTGWFVERLPAGGEDQGQRWQDVYDETAALIEWLGQVPAAERRQIVEAAMQYATRAGPFHAWMRFCEEALPEEQDEGARSNLMWVLVQVALRSGLPDRALAVAQQKQELDLGRGAEREAAISAGFKADVLFARGDLDAALRIRREEELPVYERLGGRDLVVGRAKLAITLLTRNSAGDREEARGLLCLALAEARRMQLPEAARIEAILQQTGLRCD